jgi:hypothetical protein
MCCRSIEKSIIKNCHSHINHHLPKLNLCFSGLTTVFLLHPLSLQFTVFNLLHQPLPVVKPYKDCDACQMRSQGLCEGEYEPAANITLMFQVTL